MIFISASDWAEPAGLLFAAAACQNCSGIHQTIVSCR
jgi:hypothetical protein